MSRALTLEGMKQFTKESDMRKVMPILGAAFFLATQCMAAFSNIVPGAVLPLMPVTTPTIPTHGRA